MKRLIFAVIAMIIAGSAFARDVYVTFSATRRPAAEAFVEMMEKAGFNYSYDASLLKGMRVTVNAHNAPLAEALRQMFAGTGIAFSIRGNSVILKRAAEAAPAPKRQTVVEGYVTDIASGEPLIGALVTCAGASGATNTAGHYALHVAPGNLSVTVSYPGYAPLTRAVDARRSLRIDFGLEERARHTLDEVTVEADRSDHLALHTASIGRVNLTRADINAAPALFGEADVIKTLQMQPGVSAGVEGLATMYVHGGAQDENLYMLDNVPLYQVNHFGGLFSAFNTEAIKNVDFYKSSFPARYDGRLSSIMAVNTRDGNTHAHHGSLRLGLTSGAFNIDGPISGDRTTYALALRRSWFDVISVPMVAIINSRNSRDERDILARYSFMDVNAKINHRFNDRSRLHAMFYYGNDYLKGGTKITYRSPESIISESREKDVSRLSWGNIAGSLGWRMQWSPTVWSEITGSWVRYSSLLRNTASTRLDFANAPDTDDRRDYSFGNRINDWSIRADFGINPAAGHRISLGAAFTLHAFLPESEHTRLYENDTLVTATSLVRRVRATEGTLYAGYEADITPAFRIEAGINTGLFRSSGHTSAHLDPRAAARWEIDDLTSVKLGYSRTSQYVHQLAQSSLSLPTDRWIPVPASMGPQSADKISAGVYRRLPWRLTFSGEIYYKWMHNLVDYRDDWYVKPNDAPWEQLLCTGSGRSYGMDLMVTRTFGRLTGHASYSLMWADRLFTDKNGGRRFPARFDTRHKINLMTSFKISDKWDVSAAWTGMSGNRVTLSTQDYELLDAPGVPALALGSQGGSLDFISSVNNRRLPFYHRLDLSANRHTRRGMWTFSLYNAYCNMNVIALRKVNYNQFRNYHQQLPGYPAPTRYYEKYRLIPVIPSVSYTWFF